jgi:hypothetical protein
MVAHQLHSGFGVVWDGGDGMVGVLGLGTSAAAVMCCVCMKAME